MGVASFKLIQANLDRRKVPMYFKKDLIEGKKPKDLAEVVYRLMVRNEGTALKDESKPSGYRYHCATTRMRSVQDLYAVVKNYAKVDYKDLYDIIIGLRTNIYGKSLLTYHYCSTVNREVHGGGLITREETVRNKLGEKNIKF